MFADRCLYTILGVERTASKEAIISSYRRLAMKWHPDRHLDPAKKAEAETEFKEIQKAVTTLTDDVARKAYDSSTSRADPFSRNADADSSWHWQHEATMRQQEEASRRRRDAQCKGADLQKKVSVSVEQAIHGGQIIIEETYKEICSSCKGRRVGHFTCETCRGSGRIRGRMCQGCYGEGANYEACKTCDSKGYLKSTRHVKVSTPPGCVDGTILVAKERGKASTSGGSNGDMIITLAVKAAGGWKYKGADIHGPIKINYSTAILGGRAEVQLPTGKTIQVEIPRRTNSGKLIRLAGQGLFDSTGNAHGDAILQTSIVLPRSTRKISAETEEVLRQLDG